MTALYNTSRKRSKWLVTCASGYAELGALFNACSLHQKDQSLSRAVEKAGQALDTTYLALSTLNKEWEEVVVERLGMYSNMYQSMQQLLQKHEEMGAAYEAMGEQLESLRQELATTEKNGVTHVWGKLKALMDNDPEMTRRMTCARLRDTITNVTLKCIVYFNRWRRNVKSIAARCSHSGKVS